MAGAAVMVDRVEFQYMTAERTTTVLAGTSFTVGAGEVIAIVGPNGCGKSTLLRLVAGLLFPTTGEILIDGQFPDIVRRARRMSMVFQQPVVFPWFTVAQNVGFPLRLLGWGAAARRHAVEEMLNLVGLNTMGHIYPQRLSGGMRQRVTVARALVTSPSLLLMDEPFSSVDEFTREQLHLDLLRLWSVYQPTILFVTHALSEAVFLADRVLVLSPCPSRVVYDHPILLPRPRTLAMLESSEFLMCVATVRHWCRTIMAPL